VLYNRVLQALSIEWSMHQDIFKRKTNPDGSETWSEGRLMGLEQENPNILWRSFAVEWYIFKESVFVACF
jgi:hypothetical protein